MGLRMTYNAKRKKIGLKMTHNAIKNKKNLEIKTKNPARRCWVFCRTIHKGAYS